MGFGTAIVPQLPAGTSGHAAWTPPPAQLRSAPVAERLLPLVIDLDRDGLPESYRSELALCGVHSSPSTALAVLLSALLPGRDLETLVLGRNDAAIGRLPLAARLRAAAQQAEAEGRDVILLTAAHPDLARQLCRIHAWATDAIVVPGTDALADLARVAAVRTRCPAGFVVLPGAQHDALWARNADAYALPVASEADEGAPRGRLAVLARAARLHQWAKNLLVFLPLVLAGKVFDPVSWLLAATGFLAFGLIASATYLINDLHDLPHDRAHRTKRHRPLASGAMTVPAALGTAACGLCVGLILSALVGPSALAAAAAYVVVTLAYTFAIKRYAILDTMVLGCLFTLRLVAGTAFCNVAQSSWLLFLSMLLFTSLGLVKRLVEIQQSEAGAGIPGRGYLAQDAPVILAFGAATSVSAVLVFSLYIVEVAARQGFYIAPDFLWMAPAALFLWLGRIWLLCGRKALRDDPVEFALTDLPSLGLGLVVFLSFVLACSGT